MKIQKPAFACLACGLFLLGSPGTAASPLDLDAAAFMQRAVAVQVPFVENEGQIDDGVRYYARLSSGTFFITGDGNLVYSLRATGTGSDGDESVHVRWAFRESFAGSN